MGIGILAFECHEIFFGWEIVGYVELEELLAYCSVIALHCLLLPESEGTINGVLSSE